MHKSAICFFALACGLILTAVLVAQTDKNYSPLEPEERSYITPQPQAGPVIQTKDKAYKIPRKQVLIESFTRTS
jgi:hypothetical protein